MTNLNELTHYSDPLDQWAAAREFELRSQHWPGWRAYDESDAESWARSRESWLREVGWLRHTASEAMRRMAEQLAPIIREVTTAITEAGKAFAGMRAGLTRGMR